MHLERLQDLLDRLTGYSAVEVGIELILIWIVVYVVLRFVQGTRAAGALKGLLVIIIAATIMARIFGGQGAFVRVGYLYDRLIALVAVALIVIFPPELRRALVRLGETSIFRSTPKDIAFLVDEVCEASEYLAKAKFGALIVIERQTQLGGITEGGTLLNAELSAPLLQTIFFPGSALHDLAVVVKGRRLVSAGVQLPLAEPGDMPDTRLGSRHRAAVGLTKECDALVVIVSEERGHIRLAERGKLSIPLDLETLREELRKRLRAVVATNHDKPHREVLTPIHIDDNMDRPVSGDTLAGDSLAGGSMAGSTAQSEATTGDSVSGDTLSGVNAFSALGSGDSVTDKKVV